MTRTSDIHFKSFAVNYFSIIIHVPISGVSARNPARDTKYYLNARTCVQRTRSLLIVLTEVEKKNDDRNKTKPVPLPVWRGLKLKTLLLFL